MDDDEERKGRSTDECVRSVSVQASYLGKFHSVLSRLLSCSAAKPGGGRPLVGGGR